MMAKAYTFIGDLMNVEDLAEVKGTPWLIASGLAREATNPAWVADSAPREHMRGGLRLIDRRTKTFTEIWPGIEQPVRRDPRFPDCDVPTSASTFACSGLHLEHGTGGNHTLYAVNTTERESIEIFDVKEVSDGLSLTWTGAVLLPYPCRGNSATVLPDGSIVVTITYLLNDPDFYQKAMNGEDTGYVIKWHPTEGWTKVEGLEGSAPNGIVSSTDGETLYVSYSGAGTMKAKTADGLMETVDLGFMPDNIRWDAEGMLWIGGFGNLSVDVSPRACRINPEDLRPVHIDLPADSGPFSHCSVALRIEQELWLGSFNCDYVAVLSLS